MKIRKINAYPLNATWVKYFGGEENVPESLMHPSSNFKYSRRLGQHTTLVEVIGEDGLKGYGECFGLPDALYSSLYVSRYFDPVLRGLDTDDPVKIWRIMMHMADGIGNTAGAMMEALSGIDTAVWDLKGKEHHLPVFSLLGGRINDKIGCYGTPVMLFSDVGKTKARAKELLDMGFTSIKLKIGRDAKTDLENIEAVREVAGEGVNLLLDMNCGYEGRLGEAIKLIRNLSGFDIYWIEEPFSPENIESYKRIRDVTDLRIAAGENSFTPNQFKRLVDSNAIDVIMPNIGRAGGVTGMSRIARYAGEKNVLLSPHGVGSGVSIIAALNVMAAVDNPSLYEYNQLLNPLRHEILENKILFNGSHMELPEREGLGIDINWKCVEKYIDDSWRKISHD